MKKLCALVMVLAASHAPAVNFCGGVAHQNSCGRPTNIYPCCPNGGNCTWWAWESVCRNWGAGLVNWGNANTWAGHANVDPNYDLVGPTVGSIATSTLGNYGHVAWVIATDGATVTVTEENCCIGCGGSIRTIRYNSSKFNSGFVVRHGTQCQCTPGQVQTEACGDCGHRSRTCGASCSWDGWSGCAGADPQGGNEVCSNGKLGVCADARKRCEGGNLTCRSLREPSAERCDALDNDCDGETDEGNPEEGASELDYAAKRVDTSYPRTLPAGERGTIWVEFRNMGKKTWERGDVWLATQGQSAISVPETWPAWNIAAGLSVPVAPGEVARFAFEVKAPEAPGAQLDERFKLHSPGETPITCPDSELKVPLLVLSGEGDADGGSTDGGPKHMGLESRGCTSAPGLAIFMLLALLRRRSLSLLALLLSGCAGEAVLVAANDPISVIGVTPKVVSARGGTKLTITGIGFSTSSTVMVDGHEVTRTLVSETELTIVTPPLFAGRAPLSVIEGNQWRSELLGGLEVLALELRFVEAPPHSLAMPAIALNTAATADIDSDGDGDLLTCGEACTFWMNDGHGNFDETKRDAGASDAGSIDAGVTASLMAGAMPLLPVGARFLALEDFDVDGDPDLLFAFADGGAVFQNEAGHFAGPSDWRLPSGTVATARGDLDGDGQLDLVTASTEGLRVSFHTSGLDFTARDAGALELAPTRSLALVDVNGDGQLDVIAATIAVEQGIALRLFMNASGTLTEVPGGLPGGPVRAVTALAAADLNGDHSIDLICVGEGQDRLLLNDGAAHFFDATSTLLPVDGSRGTSVALVDLDRDRDLDLLIGNAGATTRLYVNDGTGRFVDRTPLLPVRAETIAQVATGDVDGDGDADLLVLPSMADQAHLYLSVEPAP